MIFVATDTTDTTDTFVNLAEFGVDLSFGLTRKTCCAPAVLRRAADRDFCQEFSFLFGELSLVSGRLPTRDSSKNLDPALAPPLNGARIPGGGPILTPLVSNLLSPIWGHSGAGKFESV